MNTMNTLSPTFAADRAQTPNAAQSPDLPKGLPKGLPWCLWLLVLMTFTLPERQGALAATSMDPVALAKLAVRLFSLISLGWILATHWDVPRRAKVIGVLVPMGAFALWAVTTTLWSPLVGLTLGQAGGMVILVMLAAVVGICCRRPHATSLLLFHLCAAVLCFCIAVILSVDVASGNPWGMLRDGSGIAHPTTAGAAGSLGILLLLGARTLWGWRWSRIMLLPAGAVFGLTLAMAANRTALFLTAVLGGLFVCMMIDRARRWAAVVAVSIGLSAYLAVDPGWLAFESGYEAAARLAARGSASDLRDYAGRSELWQVIWQSFCESPWRGHGYFVSSAEGEIYAWYTWANWTAHNIVLQALVSTGIVGAGLLILGTTVPVALLLVKRKLRPGAVQVAWLVSIVWIWFAISGLFSSSFLGPIEPESIVFFALLGLASGYAVDS